MKLDLEFRTKYSGVDKNYFLDSMVFKTCHIQEWEGRWEGAEGRGEGDICEYLSGLSIKSPYYLCVNVNSLISVKIFGGVMKPLV